MHINEFLDDIDNKEHYLYMNRQDKILLADKLGVELRRLREDTGLGLNEFASLLKVSKAHISSIENNDRVPSKKLLVKIVDFLNLPHEHWERLNKFRVISSRINKDDSINDLINLCVELLKMPRNDATTLALNALLKNAIKKWESSYVAQFVYSEEAAVETEEIKLVDDRILPIGMALKVIDEYRLYSKQQLITLLKMFSQIITVTKEEYEIIKRHNLSRRFPIEWLKEGILCRYSYVGIDIFRDEHVWDLFNLDWN